MTATGDAAATSKSGLFEDLVEVLYVPAKVFDRTRYATAGKYVLATAGIVLVLVIATKGLMQPFFDAQFDLTATLSAAKGKPLPEAARAFSTWGILGTFVLAMLIGPFFNAAFMVLGAKLIKAPLPFARAAVIAALAGVPRIFGIVTLAVSGLFADPQRVRSIADGSLSAARFVDPATTPQVLLALLGNVDVFRIWQIALLAIGVSVVARVSRGNGFFVALITIAISLLFTVIPAAFA